MKKSFFILASSAFLALSLTGQVAFAAESTQKPKMNPKMEQQASTPVGYWQTIDDKDNQPRSIVKIWEENNQLQGKIVKVFYKEGESEKDVCTECKGEDKDKLILGMTILKGFTKDESGMWTGGTILDPKNGNVYKSRLTLSDADTLDVRGYIGLPIIGRSQIWHRIQYKEKH